MIYVAKAIMIQGTMSNAGKSIIAAALCRILSRTALRLRRSSHEIWRSIRISLTRDLKWGVHKSLQAEAANKPSCFDESDFT